MPERQLSNRASRASIVAGDSETFVAIAKINTKGFLFGKAVGIKGGFASLKDLIVGPVVALK